MLSRASVVLACFVIASVAITRSDRVEHIPSRVTFASFPMKLDEWRGIQEPPLEAPVLAVLGLDDYVKRLYYRPDRAFVGLYAAYWQSQRQGDAVHSPLNCLPGAGWQPVSKVALRVPVQLRGGATTIEVNRYVVEKGIDRQLVLYWYQSHGRVIASEYTGKLMLIADAFRLNRTDAALVRVTVPIRKDGPSPEAQAEDAGRSFVQSIVSVLDPYIPL